MNAWDSTWMAVAATMAKKSKDRSTKIGAVIVSYDNILITTGYNGFPRKVDDDIDQLHQRPDKYLWTVHAEINAICNAARKGIALAGSKMYTTMSSCSKCAPIIAQAGIVEVISYGFDDPRNFQGTNPETKQQWLNESLLAISIFNAARVTVRLLDSLQLDADAELSAHVESTFRENDVLSVEGSPAIVGQSGWIRRDLKCPKE